MLECAFVGPLLLLGNQIHLQSKIVKFQVLHLLKEHYKTAIYKYYSPLLYMELIIFETTNFKHLCYLLS
jgi:hypothetical protein